MKAWFQKTQVHDDVTVIIEPSMDSFVRANMWWFHGSERDLLFDTGNGVASLQVEIPDLFSNDPIAVISHGHPDHSGGASEFNDVRAHQADLPLLAHPYKGYLSTEVFAQQLQVDRASLPEERYLLADLPADNFEPESYQVQPVEGFTALRDDDQIDLGSRLFRVVHTPGHTHGGVVLFDETNGVLLAGDTLYSGGLVDTCRGADPEEYRLTMERILELDPAVVFPGHGPMLSRDSWRSIAHDYLSTQSSRVT